MYITKIVTIILVILVGVLSTHSNANAESLCDSIERACVAKNGNLVLAEVKMAEKIMKVLDQSAERYEQFFAKKPVPVAIVSGGSIDPDLRKKLKSLGVDSQLPWFSKADRAKIQHASILKQVEAQTAGLPAELQKAAMAQAIAQLQTSDTDTNSETIDSTEAGALSHELGHLWFIEQFAPKKSDENTGHGYGGWAPDWLDETAAVLMENEELTSGRRAAFADMSTADLIPLTKFLTMEHPVYKAAQALAETSSEDSDSGDSGGAKAIFLTGDEADAFLASAGGNPDTFYMQVRMFADFMIEQCGDKQVSAKIASHLSAGGTFEDWLSDSNCSGLPKTITELDTLWQQWMRAASAEALNNEV